MAEPDEVDFAPPPLPDGWDKLSQAPAGTLWAAMEPADADDPPRFRANLVLTCDHLGGLSFRDWQVGTDETLPRLLDDFLVIDLERLEIDGGQAGRRLAHHVDADGRALTMEQWFVQDGDRGWTLTCTAETWAYDAVADSWAEVAAAWRPMTGTSGAES